MVHLSGNYQEKYVTLSSPILLVLFGALWFQMYMYVAIFMRAWGKETSLCPLFLLPSFLSVFKSRPKKELNINKLPTKRKAQKQQTTTSNRSVMMFTTFYALILTFLCISSALPIQSSKDITLNEMDVVETARIEVPVHGNWCGPGHTGANPSTPCIDHFDCVCKDHDLCWTRYGNLNCKCDADMARTLADATGLPRLAAEYFERSPCKAPVTVPTPKFCDRCTKIFGKRYCVTVPCGIVNKCSMVPFVGKPKMSLRKYVC